MISRLSLVLFIFAFQVAIAQIPAPVQGTNDGLNSQNPSDPTVPTAPTTNVDEILDASGLVINKNVFSYDGAEGRDPFKIYREYVQPTQTTGVGSSSATPLNMEKSIRTALVPDDVVVQGIFYKKNDPIALVVVKGVKGLNKLKLNSPIGRNEGKVIDIRKDRIVIEQVKEFDGQKFSEKIELKVREKRN